MAGQQEINEALLNDVLAIYTSAEEQMLKAVAKRVAKGIKAEGWNETKLKDTQMLKNEIEKVLNSTSKVANAKVSEGILEAYKAGFQEVGGEKTVHKTILDDLDIPMNLKMQVLATNNLLNNASFQVLRKASDAYQQVMANATTGLLSGVDTRRQASQKMLNEFASKGITTFVDKAGRNWDLSSYAEMAVRTVGSHAALQGHIDRQVEVGEDLVKVSTIGTTCPICQRWQGVVLSISGKHPKYHSIETARDAGLFHPNCKHTLTMFIPELDGEGKSEPDDYDESTKSSQLYFETQKQRANERNIRYWKKRRALAISPQELEYCNEKVKAWQYKNLIHCEKHGLRRNYAREGVMVGNATGPKGTLIGGSLKEYEEVFKSVVGDNPKQLFKMNLQFFASNKTYEKWLKDEIQSLDDLDVDKAMLKDANNKNVTPTSLYKKYIGDNPGQDYAEVSEYEKGTKEYKSGYAKWLKTQIDEIGVTYKIKPKYVTVHEDIPFEDTKLSATEIYKKYHDGKKPTEAFQEAGGEAGTGMKYGKWVETQKKELIKNGITKTIPFSNTVAEKTSKVIADANEGIKKAKATVNKAELEKYKKKLEDKVHGAYDGYLQVSEVLEVINDPETPADELELAKEKLKLAEKKHLEMVQKKAEKEFNLGTGAFDLSVKNLNAMLSKETDPLMKAHIQNQIGVYEEIKKSHAGVTNDYGISVDEALYKETKKKFNTYEKAANEVNSYLTFGFSGNSAKFNAAQLVYLEKLDQAVKKWDISALEQNIATQKELLAKSTGISADHKKKMISVLEKNYNAMLTPEKKAALGVLEDVKVNPGSYLFSQIKKGVKDNIDNEFVYETYLEAYKIKKKFSIDELYDDGDFFQTQEEFDEEKKHLKEKIASYKKDGNKASELVTKMHLEAVKELEKEVKSGKKRKGESEVQVKSGKVSLGRSVRFDEGHLVKRDDIYQDLDLSDLENLSDQVQGHKLFENTNRRDILGRDRRDGHNHHRGHDVRIKSGLSDKDRELAEAFAFAYDDYFNTIKCQPINLAYLKGYDKATPEMRKNIDKINMAIKSVELSEPILLHRYVDRDIVEAIFGTTDVQSLEKGDLFDNNTFMSTSTGGHPTFGKRNYKLTLQVDKGTHALPTLNHEELEVLLGKGKLEFVRANKHTISNPQRLKNYDGSWTEFVGDEIVVRYIEDGKAQEYERVTAYKIQDMLDEQKNVEKHKREAKPWIESLSPDEMTAQKRYTGNWYSEMNNVYRKGVRSDKTITKYSEDLTEALRRAEIEKPVVLRRGIWDSDLAFMLGFNGDTSKIAANWDKINEGGYAAEDKGFLSTSPMQEGGFHKPVDLRIYCPTGTHAAYVDSISSHKGEKETLLQSGSMFKVHKMVKEGSKTVVYLELLGTD